jgi:hypothetical protein
VNLDDDRARGDRIVVGIRGRCDEATWPESLGRGPVNGIAHADLELAGDHGHMFVGRVTMRRNDIPGRELQANGIDTAFPGISLIDGEFSPFG